MGGTSFTRMRFVSLFFFFLHAVTSVANAAADLAFAMRIKRRVERDLAVMRKLEVPPQETAFILITSDKDSLTANRE